MKILIRNLPGDVSEEAIKKYLAPYCEVESLSITNEGNSERASATVEVPLSEAVAEAVCEKIRHLPMDGHPVTAEPLLFFG